MGNQNTNLQQKCQQITIININEGFFFNGFFLISNENIYSLNLNVSFFADSFRENRKQRATSTFTRNILQLEKQFKAFLKFFSNEFCVLRFFRAMLRYTEIVSLHIYEEHVAYAAGECCVCVDTLTSFYALVVSASLCFHLVRFHSLYTTHLFSGFHPSISDLSP